MSFIQILHRPMEFNLPDPKIKSESLNSVLSQSKYLKVKLLLASFFSNVFLNFLPHAVF
jgi:hypothetical protein